ncbi:MFS transporter [uncultured Winogradskyella sp.]|uniref:MFS transporter n=1 Tax=uncultured Winogradskyella sp. TaxID=395353 RepID=UPI0030DCAF84|tara:strand:- start:43810 stop:45021 length:1212 start_codon:yes stop_codon:yes gene_type:complete
MKKLYLNYIESFKGLSKEIWCLALVSLINRAGTMVIPFLSLYLKKDLDFSNDDVGWILAFFGIGSVIGSWLGGKLTDKIGFYKVISFSLFFTGLSFVALQYITTFWGLCFGILLLMSIADTFRPALFVSLKAYSKPENRTRSLALIRLAINAGMGIGPTVAGLIIVVNGYDILFWIDGLTCIAAILLFRYLVKAPKKLIYKTEIEAPSVVKNTVYKDKTYYIFLSICFLFGMAFFQLIFTLPLYYEEVFGLNEFKIGLLMFVNVAIIVFFEMPMVHYLEKKIIPVVKHITMALALLALSYYVLYDNYWIGIIVVSIVIITFSEMLGFPYTNKFAINRAKQGFEGSYMALYSVSFSLAHIFSSKISLSIIDNFGYQINWLVTGSYGTLGVLLSLWLQNRIKKKL